MFADLCKVFLIIVAVSLVACVAHASPAHQMPGPNLTYGDVTHGQRVMSAGNNPAAGAVYLWDTENNGKTGTMLSLTAGLEYGNVQDLFDLIDEISLAMKPSEPDDGEKPPGQNPDEKPPGGIDLDTIIDALDPEFKELIVDVAGEVVVQGALLSLIAVEGYAKLFVGADIPLVIGKEFLGGAWGFGINIHAESKAFGIAEEIEFDPLQALLDLETAFDSNMARQYPVGGRSVLISIEPISGRTRLQFRNDSTLLTKAAITSEFAMSYSRAALVTKHGQLFLGGEG